MLLTFGVGPINRLTALDLLRDPLEEVAGLDTEEYDTRNTVPARPHAIPALGFGARSTAPWLSQLERTQLCPCAPLQQGS
jgi:hypothetical protein